MRELETNPLEVMMLSLIFSLLSVEAEACSPGSATVKDAVPTFESISVPVDSIVRIELADGYLHTEPEVFLRQGAERLPVDIVLHRRMLDSTQEHVVLEITPLDELQPSLEYTVEMAHANGELTEITRFIAEETRSSNVVLAPVIGWVEHTFMPVDPEFSSSCNGTNRTGLYVDLSADDSKPEYSVHLYRVDPTLVYGGQEIEESLLEERFHTVLSHQQYASIETFISNTLEDEQYCFVARYANEAGQEGPISNAVCSVNTEDLHFECGTGYPFGFLGCSNLGASTASFFAMMVSMFGLVRRRRE